MRLIHRKRLPGYVLFCIAVLSCDNLHAAVRANGAFSTARLEVHVKQMLQLPAMRNQQVTIILESSAMPQSSRQLIRAHGARIRYEFDGLYEITLPVAAVDALLDRMPDTVYARLPYPHQAVAVTSQGVPITGATDMQALGNAGQGIRVGIIDLGFAAYTSAQSTGDLPQTIYIQDYTGSGYGGSSHGTNVAEIVHDMAPGAELYLAKVATETQLRQAMQDMAAAGVRIINHSAVWFGSAFYDGTGSICSITDDAESSGVTWVNAAGNSRATHYMAPFSDTDGDGRHNFSATDNTNIINLISGSQLTLVMNWDAYPTTNVDYNLYLYNGNPASGGALVASSANPQNGNRFSTPYEAISYTPAVGGTYYIVVTKNGSSSSTPRFTLFSLGPALSIRTYASSLPQPADCFSVLTVGAVDLSDNAEGFSSEGPTTDGRQKPDLSAPNRVVTSLNANFVGTSAASPHAAGAAALELARDPGLSSAALRNLLAADSQDVYTAGLDYRTGAGRISHDADLDTLNHDQDNCALISNITQQDIDGDGLGDVCDDDIDGDGLLNGFETSLGTNPYLSDSDGDGIADGEEVNVYLTDPLLTDTDYDGLTDGEEVYSYLTSPLVSNAGDLAPLNSVDGVINAADMVIMMRLVSGSLIAGSYEQIVADINNDGIINVVDALLLAKKQVGISP